MNRIHMHRNTLLTVLALLFFVVSAPRLLAESPHRLVREGNENVDDNQLDSALTNYLQARSLVDTLLPELQYNIGGVYARRGMQGDVMVADSLLQISDDAPVDLRANASYNRGNALASAEMYDQALEAYINTLMLNPDDEDAKRNLELTRRLLMKQQEQQQQQQDQEGEDQQDQQDLQNQQDQGDEQQGDQQQPQDQGEQEQQEEEQQQPQPQPGSQEEMDQLMAQRFLDRLQENEEELLQEVYRQQIPQSNSQTDKPR